MRPRDSAYAVVHTAAAAVAAVPAGDAWLTEEERAVLSLFTVEKRRADWRLGRCVGKQAAVAYLRSVGWRVAPAAIGIVAGPDGAPEPRLPAGAPSFALSLSHSGGVGFAAAGAVGHLGCDVERIEARSRHFVADYFTAEEARAMDGLEDAEAAFAANLVWSAKESALKALREGLRLDTRVVRVDEASLREGLGRASETAPSWKAIAIDLRDGPRFHGLWRRDQQHVWTVVADVPVAVVDVRRLGRVA